MPIAAGDLPVICGLRFGEPVCAEAYFYDAEKLYSFSVVSRQRSKMKIQIARRDATRRGYAVGVSLAVCSESLQYSCSPSLSRTPSLHEMDRVLALKKWRKPLVVYDCYDDSVLGLLRQGHFKDVSTYILTHILLLTSIQHLPVPNIKNFDLHD